MASTVSDDVVKFAGKSSGLCSTSFFTEIDARMSSYEVSSAPDAALNSSNNSSKGSTLIRTVGLSGIFELCEVSLTATLFVRSAWFSSGRFGATGGAIGSCICS